MRILGEWELFWNQMLPLGEEGQVRSLGKRICNWHFIRFLVILFSFASY